MDHERAFLQAIRDEPDNDAARLIYADWLEEQGGAERTARAIFIRAQCRLAALPEDDPSRDVLEDEAAEVLAEYERQWTEPLHGIAKDWQFSRGFLESVTVRGGDFLTHTEYLFDFALLRSIFLEIDIADIPRLAACPQLQRIEKLYFFRCHLHDRALRQLLTSAYLGRLIELVLWGNEITTPGIQALIHSAVFPRLKSLDLGHNSGVGDRAVRLLARGVQATNLEALDLSGTNISESGLHDLLASHMLPRLMKLNVTAMQSNPAYLALGSRSQRPFPLLAQLHNLDMSVCPLESVTEVLASPQLTNLRSLDLAHVPLGRQGAEILASAVGLTHLKVLDLNSCDLGTAGLKVLADSSAWPALKDLRIGSNNIRDEGAKTIAACPWLRRLSSLYLSGNGIGGPGLQALASSDNLDGIRSLWLGGNFIGVDSVRALAESPHLVRLRSLDLSGAYLEENSARVLAESENLAHLRYLWLEKNLLGDDGVRALAQSPHLRRLVHLDLHDNRIGKAGAEALAAAPHWRYLRHLDLRGNIFTDTQEKLLRDRFGSAVKL